MTPYKKLCLPPEGAPFLFFFVFLVFLVYSWVACWDGGSLGGALCLSSESGGGGSEPHTLQSSDPTCGQKSVGVEAVPLSLKASRLQCQGFAALQLAANNACKLEAGNLKPKSFKLHKGRKLLQLWLWGLCCSPPTCTAQ